jgi:hypothetical protein
MFVWVLKVNAHDDSPYIAGVYDDPDKARAGFESILNMWWKENRESQDYNGRNYEECVKDMVFNDDRDYLEVERFEVQ